MTRKIISVALFETEYQELTSFAWVQKKTLSDVVRMALGPYYAANAAPDTLELVKARQKAAEEALEDLKRKVERGELVTRAEVLAKTKARVEAARARIRGLADALAATTGVELPPEATDSLKDSLLVFDEAYGDFCERIVGKS